MSKPTFNDLMANAERLKKSDHYKETRTYKEKWYTIINWQTRAICFLLFVVFPFATYCYMNIKV